MTKAKTKKTKTKSKPRVNRLASLRESFVRELLRCKSHLSVQNILTEADKIVNFVESKV